MINLIMRAFDKNWTLVRPGMEGYQNPVTGHALGNHFMIPEMNIKFIYRQDKHEETYRTKLPRIMACLMAQSYGVEDEETMLMLNIEQQDAFDRYISAAKKAMKMARRAKEARDRVQSVHDLDEETKNAYRVYLKWHLCMNYIKLHKSKDSFFSENLLKW